MAGGSPEGRRPAPRQRRMLAAELRGDRRGGPTRQARSRGWRVRRGRGRRSGARRGPRGDRRTHRLGRFRRRLHHRVEQRTRYPAQQLGRRTHRCLSARRIRPEPGCHGRQPIPGQRAARRRPRPSRRRRRRPAPCRRSARPCPPHPAGQPPRGGPTGGRARRGVPRSRSAACGGRRSGTGTPRLRGRCRRDLQLVTQMDGRPEGRRRTGDSS